jgi:aminoglycoside phosphotransferase family enzyme/predicted kinase
MAQEPLWMKGLLDPGTSPHAAKEVHLIQTHISWVFVSGDRVYKIKKPVDFGFLDFSTIAKRRHFCLEELRLNRRLCPDIYLDVLPITLDGDRPRLGGTGDPVEWAVVMRRMPETGMMTRLLEERLVGKEEIAAIVAKLTPFYREAAGDEEIRRYGKIETIEQNTEENFEQTVSFVGDIFEHAIYSEIRAFTRAFMAENRDLILERIEKGWIREGHGDLYSANICFDEQENDVYIFDCIEFNQRFRCGDVASDVAFLAMDLDFHGLPQLSNHFVRSFADRTGDEGLLELMDFYKCYRAYVRGKIGCFTWASPGVDEQTRQHSRAKASQYFRLALRYTRALKRPTLYVFFGLSGTGKSTLAVAWSERQHLAVYNSDRARKELVAGIPAEERRWEPFEQGLYSPTYTMRTYRTLASLAGAGLMRGESVVLDATYTDENERKRLIELAREAAADIKFILCTCPEEEINRRLIDRAQIGDQVSDGRWEIYLRQKERFASTGGLGSDQLYVLRTDRPLDVLLNELDGLRARAERTT